ncbi:YtnP family quorum-quenching lactonase [Alkalicoccus halolimnae]|uniref:MBL fold metallo-hydrolase n=1 Tax=Alkalicoccus halolimnae TaxID=1667239 RepID=A0A5C7FFI1_9BACI|nr:MBL fold metallo-hydrolase [Alkalicoccus halolimnae]TXF81300.1 MBL fold metallo-hydrolase [Alkalicoccus halolimnae]
MTLEQFRVSDDTTLTWLNGGVTNMDGGAMFGVVPRPLWSKKYPVNEKNQIELRCDPVLIQVPGKNLLMEAGIGKGRLSEKALRNYGVTEEAAIEENLNELGLSAEDIDEVLMTHMHFDHSMGLTKETAEGRRPMYPNAVIWVNETEWEEMRTPNIRSKNTYFKENWDAIEHQVRTFKEEKEVFPGIRLIHTGGHSAGHCILNISRGDKNIWHMADIMPTHAHQHVLWVLAYDDYPMDSISKKQEFIPSAIENGNWFMFYHDYKYRMLRWDESGKEIIESLERKEAEEK